MTESIKKYIAFLFLLCIGVTFVSFNPYHEHTKDVQICGDHVDGEVNPCHETIFHQDSSEISCFHQSHVSTEIEECEFCKFTSTRRYEFLITESAISSTEKNYGAPVNSEVSLTLIQVNRCFQGRAPPISSLLF